MHGSLLDAELREALLEHAQFAETVEVVVVEFANPRHQDLLDRLILDGESLDRQALRPIWLDAGMGLMWDLSIYENFFQRMAELNRERPREKRIRILGAALPIDWPKVHTAQDLEPWRRDRRGHFESVLRREILEKRRRGLAIFGAGHCELRSPSLLSRLPRERVRTILGFEGEKGRAAGRVAFGPAKAPRLLPVRAQLAASWPSGDMLFEGHAGSGARLGELVDALIDYGPAIDQLLGPDDLALSLEIEEELRRRATLWDEAKRL